MFQSLERWERRGDAVLQELAETIRSHLDLQKETPNAWKPRCHSSVQQILEDVDVDTGHVGMLVVEIGSDSTRRRQMVVTWQCGQCSLSRHEDDR